MAERFEFEIVTPDRLVAKATPRKCRFRKTGYLGILAGHAPLITELDVGEITYRTTGADLRWPGILQRFCPIRLQFSRKLPSVPRKSMSFALSKPGAS